MLKPLCGKAFGLISAIPFNQFVGGSNPPRPTIYGACSPFIFEAVSQITICLTDEIRLNEFVLHASLVCNTKRVPRLLAGTGALQGTVSRLGLKIIRP